MGSVRDDSVHSVPILGTWWGKKDDSKFCLLLDFPPSHEIVHAGLV